MPAKTKAIFTSDFTSETLSQIFGNELAQQDDMGKQYTVYSQKEKKASRFTQQLL